MALSLKDKNKLPLIAIVWAKFAVFVGLLKGGAVAGAGWVALLSQPQTAIPATVALILIGVVNAQLPSELKAQIVFMRRKNSMPGCEAFTRVARKDSRVDLTFL